MKSILQPYIKNEIKHIIIPDGIGGLLEIEHLILLDQGLFLIETYPMAGNLYGAETIDLWTQIVDGRSYKFDNPLRRLRISRQAIKSLAPDIPVFCRVIFNSDSIFPKGKPSEVSVLESLAEDMLLVKNEKRITNQAQQTWDTIMRIARKDGQAVTRQGDIHG
ncbi:NERD domain-containing protein [Pseudomonadota bacterium]|nr:NERD domain-containing protein [Pseudomonadota bacterium]